MFILITRFSAIAETLFNVHDQSSWIPETQPGDSRAATWLSFWRSTWPSVDKTTDLDENDKKRKSAISYITIYLQITTIK